VKRCSSAGYFDEGFLRRLGYWRGDGYAATIGESNTLPSITGYYYPDGSSARVSSVTNVENSAHYKVQKYKTNSGLGNWVGGIGGIKHGNFVSGFEGRHIFVTVFNPKIIKTELERVEFNFRYTWSQHE
jgi:hypothetical protein